MAASCRCVERSALRAGQNPDLLAAVGGWPASEVAVVGDHLEADHLEEVPHLAPQRPAQGELLGGGPKHLASCVDLAECPVFDDELVGRIGPLARDLPRDAVSRRWMNELAAWRGDLGVRDDEVEPRVEQVEDEPAVRAGMGPKGRQRLPLCGGRQHELEDPSRRHDEREVASEIEGPHVRSVEEKAGRDIGGQRRSPLFRETQHWPGEVDADDLVTIPREGRGHPTSAAPDLQDRSARLSGQSPVEVGVALHWTAVDEARAQGVIDLGVQAVGLVKGVELRLLAHGSSVASIRYGVKAFRHRRRRALAGAPQAREAELAHVTATSTSMYRVSSVCSWNMIGTSHESDVAIHPVRTPAHRAVADRHLRRWRSRGRWTAQRYRESDSRQGDGRGTDDPGSAPHVSTLQLAHRSPDRY